MPQCPNAPMLLLVVQWICRLRHLVVFNQECGTARLKLSNPDISFVVDKYIPSRSILAKVCRFFVFPSGQFRLIGPSSQNAARSPGLA